MPAARCCRCTGTNTLCVVIAIRCAGFRDHPASETVSVRYQGPNGEDVTHDLDMTAFLSPTVLQDCYGDSPASGDWTVTVTPPAGYTWSEDCEASGDCVRVVTVSGKTTVNYTFDPDTYDVTVNVSGCCGPNLEGASVTLSATGGGGGGGTATTDASGNCTFTLDNPPADSISVSVSPPTSPPGYDSASATFTPDVTNGEWGFSYCGPPFLRVVLPTLSTYACVGFCSYPIKKQLHWSDDDGSCILTAAAGICQSASKWTGTYSQTVDDGAVIDAYGNCSGPTTTIIDMTITAEIVANTAGASPAYYWQLTKEAPGSCSTPVTTPGECTTYPVASRTNRYDFGVGSGSSPGEYPFACDPDTPIDVPAISFGRACPASISVRNGHLSE